MGGTGRSLFDPTERKVKLVVRQIWETVSKAGLMTANLMWPGPLKTARGISPTYLVPWKVSRIYAFLTGQVLNVYWLGSCPVTGKT